MYKNWKGGGKITLSHADLNQKTQENQLGKCLQIIIKFSEISRHTVMYKNDNNMYKQYQFGKKWEKRPHL